jgi:hypothetical protein
VDGAAARERPRVEGRRIGLGRRRGRSGRDEDHGSQREDEERDSPYGPVPSQVSSVERVLFRPQGGPGAETPQHW